MGGASQIIIILEGLDLRLRSREAVLPAVEELGLSQKPSPTAQPSREAGPTLPFPLLARLRSSPFIYVCYALIYEMLILR